MELIQNADQLILDADAVAGVSSLTVQSILGVDVNKILLIGEPGGEFSEIIATHASTVPSGNTVTLLSALVENHPAGTVIYVIPFNKLHFYRSATEDDANTDASGLTSLASAQAIDPTQVNNHFDDTTYTAGYYFWRFEDSINSVNGIYSDPIPWDLRIPQWAKNKVGYVLDFAKRKLGFEWGQKFTKQDALDEINACLQYIDGKQLRWPKHFVGDYALGQTSRGVFEFTLPTNIYDDESTRSILSVRLQGQNVPLKWADDKEFESLMADAIRTTVRTQPSVGQTTFNLVNSYSLGDSGTVHVYTSNTDDAITYTGVTRSTTVGQLTGVPASGDGSIAATHAVATNVWQNPTEGQPLWFNVRQGQLRIWPLVDSTWINKNIFLDYYTVVTAVDSEDDILDVDRYDMVKHWLLWKAKSYTRNDGKDDLTDADWLEFKDILGDAIKKKPSNQKFKWKPKINQILYGRRSKDSSRWW